MREFAAAALCVLLLMAPACTGRHAEASTPTTVEAAPIVKNLRLAALDGVRVQVNCGQRVVTLKGEVGSPSLKVLAEDIARSNAVGYAIANEIDVRTGGSVVRLSAGVDRAIAAHWKELEARYHWNAQRIRSRVKNGVLTLEGEVDSSGERERMERYASRITGVQQIVDELNVVSASR